MDERGCGNERVAFSLRIGNVKSGTTEGDLCVDRKDSLRKCGKDSAVEP